MAKKKKTDKRPADVSPADEALEHDHLDEQPQVRTAADTLRAAQEELRRAEAQYHKVRQQAAEKIEEIRDTTVGEMVDGALDVVRKHPGPSLLAAAALGFLFDRWLRK